MILVEALSQTAGCAGAGARNTQLFALGDSADEFPAGSTSRRANISSRSQHGNNRRLWMFDVRAAVGGTTVAAGQIILNEIGSEILHLDSIVHRRARPKVALYIVTPAETPHRMGRSDELVFDVLVAMGSLLAGVIGALIDSEAASLLLRCSAGIRGRYPLRDGRSTLLSDRHVFGSWRRLFA